MRRTLPIATALLIVLIAAELAGILFLNRGTLVYAFDDAYIHMALAENIRQGNYGVNPGEFSAPSSSIIWPFILALSPSIVWFPLLLNIVFAVLTFGVFGLVLDRSFRGMPEPVRALFTGFFLMVLVFTTNLIGLIFVGMEHSLQLLIVSLVAYGLIVEAEESRVKPWLLFAIVLAPLVRYEDLAVSAAALVYLLLRRRGRSVAISCVLMGLLMGGFSLYLLHKGLGPFPTSVLDKSSVVASGGKLGEIARNLKENLGSIRGKVLLLAALLLSVYVFRVKNNGERLYFAGITVMGLGLHLVLGRCGMYRYENYVWMFFLLIGGYLAGRHPFFSDCAGKIRRHVWALSFLGFSCLLVCMPNILKLVTLPLACNNIYEQQYQMHRFAVDFYHKPVAVNDLVLVSYQNNSYVLELWGLASIEALRQRRASSGTRWMSTMAAAKNVKFAMIYEGWFGPLPENWTKVGTLHLGKKRIAPAGSDVAFYCLDPEVIPEVLAELLPFVETLPDDVLFTFAHEPGQ